jgi:hypothetical protein
MIASDESAHGAVRPRTPPMIVYRPLPLYVKYNAIRPPIIPKCPNHTRILPSMNDMPVRWVIRGFRVTVLTVPATTARAPPM